MRATGKNKKKKKIKGSAKRLSLRFGLFEKRAFDIKPEKIRKSRVKNRMAVNVHKKDVFQWFKKKSRYMVHQAAV